MQDSESEVVGWFTTVFPIQLDGLLGNSIFYMIKVAKDTRRKVLGKGRPYFASRFYNISGQAAFEAHKLVELIFNYRGSFQ
ncbi:hypothetical protein J3459_016933 [Metarhizium acridum]|nr:hypothetical protein J3459_016933 [Metarhizium acridum]